MFVDHDAFARACPAYKEVWEVVVDLPYTERGAYLYEHCDLDRYGLDRADLGSSRTIWGLHQWLLEQGLTAAQARTISRAVLLSEQRAHTRAGIFVGLTLPEVAKVEQLRTVYGPVHVTTDAVLVDDQKILALTDGRINPGDYHDGVVPSLLDSLSYFADSESFRNSDDERWWLHIAADRNTRMETLMGVARTGARAPAISGLAWWSSRRRSSTRRFRSS